MSIYGTWLSLSLTVPFLLGAIVTLAAVAWAKELLRP